MLEGLFPDILITTLSSSGFLVLWFYSPFKCTLAKMIFKVEECYDPNNFDDLLGLKFRKLGLHNFRYLLYIEEVRKLGGPYS